MLWVCNKERDNALFVSPLFDLTQLTNFADDNFYLEWNTNLARILVDMEKNLEMITKWLRDCSYLGARVIST